MTRCAWALSFLLLTSLLAGEARATSPAPEPTDSPPTKQPDRWRVGLEALTDFPLQVGGAVHVEGPYRLRLHTSLGVMPKPYLDTINAISTEAGWYDQLTADLISAALEQSLVWRLRAGWRPFADYGFYFGAGYSLATLGGGLSGAETVSTLTGVSLPQSTDPKRQLDIQAQVHMLDVEAGWQWLFADAFLLRASLGGTFTADSSTTATANWSVRPAARSAISSLETEGAAYVDDIIETYVHTPTITVAAGYVF